MRERSPKIFAASTRDPRISAGSLDSGCRPQVTIPPSSATFRVVGIALVRFSAEPDAIEPKSILAEELLAIRQRHFRSDLLEAAIKVIPRAFEAIHRKIRGKHASLNAKDPDRLANYRLIGCERPRLTQYRKAGDLAVDVIWQCR